MIDNELIREAEKFIVALADDPNLEPLASLVKGLLGAISELSAEMNEVKDERNWLRKVVEEHIKHENT